VAEAVELADAAAAVEEVEEVAELAEIAEAAEAEPELEVVAAVDEAPEGEADAVAREEA